MGYTHYWRRPIAIEADKMKAIVQDFQKLVPVLESKGVVLAGGLGEGPAEITEERIFFNGVENCGHQRQELGITWPARGASGVQVAGEEPVAGSWFAGAQLVTRACGGDCSHETFAFPRDLDVAVTAALIVIKRHLAGQIIISSDGNDSDWFDGQMLCETVLGYGLGYDLEALGK